MRTVFIAGLLAFVGTLAHAQELYIVPDGVETRWASPVYFRQEIRVTLQQIGFIWSNDGTPEKPLPPPVYAAGEGLRELDLKHLPQVSCVYFYLDRAENGLPALAPAGERMKGV